MTWTLLWSERAKEDLQILGSAEIRRIVKKIESHLVKNPLELGKPLRGSLSGLYRYRIGDYRVIYKAVRNEMTVMVIRVGHRKDMYE